MSSINKVILVGYLGRDPEVRFTPDGLKIVNISVATTESWKDKNTGERKDKTEWHKVVIMNERLADVAEKYLKKGSKLYLEGQLQTRKWTDNKGIDHFTTEVLLSRYRGEIVLLDSKASNDVEVQQERPKAQAKKQSNQSVASSHDQDLFSPNRSDIDDEIPF